MGRGGVTSGDAAGSACCRLCMACCLLLLLLLLLLMMMILRLRLRLRLLLLRRPARVGSERWVGSGLRDGLILRGGVALRHGGLRAVALRRLGLRAVPLRAVPLGLVTLGLVPLRAVPMGPMRHGVIMGPMRFMMGHRGVVMMCQPHSILTMRQPRGERRVPRVAGG